MCTCMCMCIYIYIYVRVCIQPLEHYLVLKTMVTWGSPIAHFKKPPYWCGYKFWQHSNHPTWKIVSQIRNWLAAGIVRHWGHSRPFVCVIAGLTNQAEFSSYFKWSTLNHPVHTSPFVLGLFLPSADLAQQINHHIFRSIWPAKKVFFGSAEPSWTSWWILGSKSHSPLEQTS